MHFGLSDEQRQVRQVARDLLASRSPFATVRAAAEAGAYDPGLWAELVALGWPGIAVSAEHGGQGLGAVELTVMLEQLGYACAAAPLLGTAVGAAVIQAAGSAVQRRRWLPQLCSGEATAGVGTARLAADAPAADVIVLLEGDRARLLDRRQADVEELVTIDPTRRFATVAGEGEPLGSGAAQRARIAIAAELVGVSQRALEMTVEYVKHRRQFGVPVGSFQAVSHRCAQMLLATESARSAAYFGAWAADADPDRLPEAAALAAAAAADAGREVTASGIQAHGGFGFTWEADVHWLYKRAQLDAALLATPQSHRATLARIAAARTRRSATAAPERPAGADG